ncbi:MAG: DUF4365 domain-containing protein [Acidobacteria bacterium]|nr:DUF4365 domain-containing protein [Acidobacteriota bacterium]
MKRPEQHNTDSAGKALLADVFAKLGWVVNEIQVDYGRDFQVEVFQDNESTGTTFDVQLKSSQAPAYSAAGDFISQEIATASARYLCRELRSPALLIVADVKNRRLFWAAPQLDMAAQQALDDDKNTKTLTVRVPTSQGLPASKEALLTAIGQARVVLASRSLLEVSTAKFAASTEKRLDQAALSQNLRDKSDFLNVREAENQSAAGDLTAARETLKDVLGAVKSSIEVKLYALLMAEKIETLAVAANNGPQGFLPRIALATAWAMQQLTRKGPGHLKFFSLIARHAAELYLLADTDWGLFLNWRVHEREGDALWQLHLAAERKEIATRAIAKYRQCMRLVRLAGYRPYRASLTLAMLRILDGLAILLIRLNLEGLTEAADAYRAAGLELCKMVAAIARENGDDDSLLRAATGSALKLTHPGAGL